jgi:hypothetical protein
VKGSITSTITQHLHQDQQSVHHPPSPTNDPPSPTHSPPSVGPPEDIQEVPRLPEDPNHLPQAIGSQQEPIPNPPSQDSVLLPIPSLEVQSTPTPKIKPLPTALATLQEKNTNDVHCVLWILWNITDPEALDAAIRLAGTIPWFKDGLKVEPPYDLIVSTFKACFDFNGDLYPALGDRAYYSGQAVLWIHICAMCKSPEFARRFPLPSIYAQSVPYDDDLTHLLKIFSYGYTPLILSWMYQTPPECTPTYMWWVSNALLHLSWAKQSIPATFNQISEGYSNGEPGTIPLNVMLNRLLASCIFFGWPVDEEVLGIQDKSYVISYPLLISNSLLFYLSAITLMRLYPNFPKQWLGPSKPPSLNANSSKAC